MMMNSVPRSSLSFLTMVVHFYLLRSVTSSAAGSETLVGIVGPDFILLGADSSVSQSIALTASNLDKIAVVSDPGASNNNNNNNDSRNNPTTAAGRQQTIAAAAAGDAADADRLLGELTAIAAIREYEASVGADVEYVSLLNDSASSSNKNKKKNKLPNNKVATLPAAPSGLSVDACAQLARGQIATRLRSRNPLKVCLLVAGMTRTSLKEIQREEGVLASSASLSFTARQVQMQVDLSANSVLGRTIENTAARNNQKTPVHVSTASKEASAGTTALLQPRLYWIDEYGSMQRLQYGAHGFASNFVWSILDQGYRPNMTRQEAKELLQECFAQLRTRYVINSPQPPCIKCIDAEGCRLLD